MRFSALLAVLIALPLSAAVVGISTTPQSITQERINQLPAAQRKAWTEYLNRSNAQKRADRAALAAEIASLKSPAPPPPPEGHNARGLALDKPNEFYATPEARHAADVVLSYQIPNGGWSKNLDMTQTPRQPGQSYTTNNISKHLGPEDFDAPRDPSWNYVGTLDNDATITQIQFLARVQSQAPAPDRARYQQSILRGIQYMLNAQFPNGGFPQVWPLEGGYHDAITFNDDAMTQALGVLQHVANADPNYAFAPAPFRAQAASAVTRGIDCILRTQITIDGHPTVWAQQHDPLSLAPEAGRNFEPAALVSAESAAIVRFLMALPHPTPAVVAAVYNATTWLEAHKIMDHTWGNTNRDRVLTPQPGAGPLWPRYTSPTTGKPIFGDRDKSIHDDVTELSLERRRGYAWYNSSAIPALEEFATWSKQHPAPRIK